MSVKNLCQEPLRAQVVLPHRSVRSRDAFVSHCKRVAGNRCDRALWVVDTLEDARFNEFFDRNASTSRFDGQAEGARL